MMFQHRQRRVLQGGHPDRPEDLIELGPGRELDLLDDVQQGRVGPEPFLPGRPGRPGARRGTSRELLCGTCHRFILCSGPSTSLSAYAGRDLAAPDALRFRAGPQTIRNSVRQETCTSPPGCGRVRTGRAGWLEPEPSGKGQAMTRFHNVPAAAPVAAPATLAAGLAGPPAGAGTAPPPHVPFRPPLRAGTRRFPHPWPRHSEPFPSSSWLPADSEPEAGGWKEFSLLELAAGPGSVPRARRHVRQVLSEWNLGLLGEAAELVVSELVTNAIRASRDAGG